MAPIPAIEAIIAALGLQPHPEGGFFFETYRSHDAIPQAALPAGRYAGTRAFSTGIYYLITADTYSSMHRIASDEIFHFYLGDPVAMLQLHPGGGVSRHRLGTDILCGARPQVLVPADSWQGMRLEEGGQYALLGCTVAPGFDFADFELGPRAPLCAAWPSAATDIARLTPNA